ncbi:unnamed protein product, partial [Amoebophrya sp. A25]
SESLDNVLDSDLDLLETRRRSSYSNGDARKYQRNRLASVARHAQQNISRVIDPRDENSRDVTGEGGWEDDNFGSGHEEAATDSPSVLESLYGWALDQVMNRLGLPGNLTNMTNATNENADT